MTIYNFPAKREDIEKCDDVTKLNEWRNEFKILLEQMENEYGDRNNFPDNVQRFFTANKYNLKTIDFKIRLLTKAISPMYALKCFHDKVRNSFPNEYGHIVMETLAMLGQPDSNWDELIKPKPRNQEIIYSPRRYRKRICHDLRPEEPVPQETV